MEDKQKSGRPTNRTEREKRTIIRIITNEHKISADYIAIANHLEKYKQINIHPENF